MKKLILSILIITLLIFSFSACKDDEFTVTFDSNGGTAVASQVVNYNQKAIEPYAPTKDGYRFVGWYVGSEKWSFITHTVTSDITLVAKWEVNDKTDTTAYVNVTFDSKGGSYVQPQIIEKNRYITPPISPTLAGYTFDGWYYDEEKWIFANYTANNDITLTAKWVANENELILYGNEDDNNATKSIKIKTDEVINLPKNTFIKKGYSFVGWANTSDGEVSYFNEAEYKMGADIGYSLYAVWMPNLNSILFDGNGASYGLEFCVNAHTGETISLPENSYSKNGYTFKGWSNTDTGEDIFNVGETFTIGKDTIHTLYAIWVPNKNTLKFDGNGATDGSMNEMTIDTDVSINLIENKFSKDGFVFKGWSTTKDGDVIYKNKDLYTMGTEPVYTLYAVWGYETFYIVYNLEGGTNDKDNPTTYDKHSTVLLKNPTREGYEFDGWFTDDKFENEIFQINEGTSGTVILYAKWTPNLNTLHFDGNGAIEGTMSDVTIASNGSITLPSNLFTKSNFEFIGWATSPNGDVIYKDGAVFTMGVEKSYTLYAIWKAKGATIVINGNGATIGHTDTISLMPENYFTIPENTFIKNGYKFNENGEWSLYCKTCDSNLKCGDTVLSDNGYLNAGEKVLIPSYHDYELIAQWQKIVYCNITFNPTNGTVDEYSRKVEEDTPIGVLPVPIRSGYLFDGWYIESNGESIRVKITDHFSSDTILVAKWSEGKNIANSAEITVASGHLWEECDFDYIIDGDINTGTYTPKGRVRVIKFAYDDEHFVSSVIVHINGAGELINGNKTQQIFDTVSVQINCYDKDGNCILTSDVVDTKELSRCEIVVNKQVAEIDITLTPKEQTSLSYCSIWEVEVISGTEIDDCGVKQENVANQAILSSTLPNGKTGDWWAMDLNRLIDGDINTGTHTVKARDFSIWMNFGTERNFYNFIIHCNGKGKLSSSTGLDTSTMKDSNGVAYGDNIIYNSYKLAILMYDKYGNVVYQTDAINVSNIDKLDLKVNVNAVTVELRVIDAGNTGFSGSIYMWDIEAYEAICPHSYEIIDIIAPNCSFNGAYIYECKCGARYEEVISKNDCHIYKDGVIITDPTENSNGLIEYTCVFCGKKETQEIPAISHNWGNGVVTAPTCTEKGYITIYCQGCSVNNCNASFVTNYISELGHDYGNAKRTLNSKDSSKLDVTMECLRDGCNSKKTTTMSINYYENEIVITKDNVTQFKASDNSSLIDNIFDGKLNGNFWCAPGSYTSSTQTRDSGSLEFIFDKEYIFTRASIHVLSANNWVEIHFMYQDDEGEWQTSATYKHDRLDTFKTVTEIDMTPSLNGGARASKIVIEVVSSGANWEYPQYRGSSLQFHEIELTAHECVYDLSDYILEGEYYIPASCTKDGQAMATCYVCKSTSLVKLQSEIFGHNYGEVVVDTAPSCSTVGIGHYVCQNANCQHISQDVIIPNTNEHKYTFTCIIDTTKTNNGIYAYCCENCKEVLFFYADISKFIKALDLYK